MALCALHGCLLAATISNFAGASAPLELSTALAAALPAPEVLAVAGDLAAIERELGRAPGWLLDAPSVAVETGPRRSGTTELDLMVAVDLPLQRRPTSLRAARTALAAARGDLVAAAEVEARLALTLAFVAAWAADEGERLAAADLALAEAWESAIAGRVAAGSEAVYEGTLAAAEVDRSRQALALAREHRVASWLALAARAAVGEVPQPLARPMPVLEPASKSAPEPTPKPARAQSSPPSFADPAARAPADSSATWSPSAAPSVAIPAAAADALATRAVASRLALDRALLAATGARAASRWTLAGSLAREGDEKVARLGVGYRLPRGGEREDLERARAAREGLLQRDAELAQARLAARRSAASELLAALPVAGAVTPAAISAGLAALDARLAAGKDRPSQVLATRRELLAARAGALSREAARLRASCELAALTTPVATDEVCVVSPREIAAEVASADASADAFAGASALPSAIEETTP